MIKKIIIILLVVLSFNLYSLDLNPTTELFGIGLETRFKSEDGIFIIGFPTQYFSLNNDRLLLSIQSAEVKVMNYEIQDLSFLKTGVMISLFEPENVYIGPFIDLELNSFNDLSFTSNVGLRLHFMYDIAFLESINPIAVRVVSLETGYSITDNRFYLEFTADPVIAGVFLAYIFAASSYEEATGEQPDFDSEKNKSDDDLREEFNDQYDHP